MKRSTYFLIFLIFYPLLCFSQQRDSLLQIWHSSSHHDTVRAKALNLIVGSLLQSKPDSALIYIAEQYKLAEQSHDSLKMAKSRARAGTAYMLNGSHLEALQSYNQALKIFSSLQDSLWESNVCNNLAILYDNQGNYDLALHYYTRSKKLIEVMGKDGKMATLFNNMGSLVLDQDEYRNSIDYFNKALTYAAKDQNWKNTQYAYNNLGAAYAGLKMYDSARYFFFESLKVTHKQMPDELFESALLNNVGEVFKDLGQYDSAELYFNMSLKIKNNIGYSQGIINANVNLAELEYHRGRFNKAEKMAMEALAMARDHAFITEARDAYKLLYEIYKSTRKDSKALKMHEQYHALSDSIANEKVNQELLRLFLKDDFQERAVQDSLAFARQQQIKDLEIRNQSVEIKAHKRQITLLITIVIALFILLLGGYRYFLQKKRDTAIISRKNSELKVLNDEVQRINDNLEKIIYERTLKLNQSFQQLSTYHHDLVHNVRRPLASIIGLLRLIEDDRCGAEHTREALSHLCSKSDEIDELIRKISNEMNQYEDQWSEDFIKL